MFIASLDQSYYEGMGHHQWKLTHPQIRHNGGQGCEALALFSIAFDSSQPCRENEPIGCQSSLWSSINIFLGSSAAEHIIEEVRRSSLPDKPLAWLYRAFTAFIARLWWLEANQEVCHTSCNSPNGSRYAVLEFSLLFPLFAFFNYNRVSCYWSGGMEPLSISLITLK